MVMVEFHDHDALQLVTELNSRIGEGKCQEQVLNGVFYVAEEYLGHIRYQDISATATFAPPIAISCLHSHNLAILLAEGSLATSPRCNCSLHILYWDIIAPHVQETNFAISRSPQCVQVQKILKKSYSYEYAPCIFQKFWQDW